jgi:citrate lyase beta subunit
MAGTPLAPFQELVDRFEARRIRLVEDLAAVRTARLPLKFLRQQAHFTTPASNYEMGRKAVEKGCSAAARILEKFRISTADLAAALEVTQSAVEEELGSDPRAPLVMLDSEDAEALREDVIERGRQNAVRVFREADWGPALRFYRPSGVQLPFCLPDLAVVLARSAEGLAPHHFPIDGITWPKPEHPEEMVFVCDFLTEMERELGLKENRIKLTFLVESGWAAAQLPALVMAALPRLAGIIFGIADYSADVGLPGIVNDHPVCDWARSAIVNVAGAAGVPAIDNMTMSYPVADPRRSDEDNRGFILERLRKVYADARHGIMLGMDGKWVGHPLQLFVVRLAYRLAIPDEEIRAETDRVLRYSESVAAERGTAIIQGAMSDRATDRHARERLRKAIALGRLDARKGLELGLISREEYEEFAGS